MKPTPARLVPLALVAALGAMLAVPGCDSKPKTAATTAPAAVLPASFFLAEAPSGVVTVEEARKGAKPGDSIAVRGRVGGSRDPFVPGRAVFTLMGPDLPSCSDNPADKCRTPWDYCCETPQAISAHMASVQFTDSSGTPFKADVKGQHGIKELSELVVVGKVLQAGEASLVLSATGIYVAKP